VVLTKTDGQLAVTVSDDGTGFDPGKANTAGRLGLEGMRERVEILGGSFQLRTAPGQGTVIQASLPLQLTGIDYD
jgi:signal transduction histidine kinase